MGLLDRSAWSTCEPSCEGQSTVQRSRTVTSECGAKLVESKTVACEVLTCESEVTGKLMSAILVWFKCIGLQVRLVYRELDVMK